MPARLVISAEDAVKAFGGMFVEVLVDSVLMPVPVRRARGTTPTDLDLFAAVARFGGLAIALGPELESLEVNPLPGGR